MTVDLPSWDGPRGGSGCDNDDCEASDQYVRVMSREEIERVFPVPDRLPGWPLPDQYTHMCTRCGEGYAGYPIDRGFGSADHDLPDPDVDAWDWSPDDAFAGTVREVARSCAEGAPDDAPVDAIVEAIDRYVPGADRDLARGVLAEMGRVAADPAADYL